MVLLSYWQEFHLIGPREVGSILGTVISATCALDPCLSWLVEASWEVMDAWIQDMVNSSLQDEIFAFKEEFVCPLPKRPSLDATVQNDFFPISSLLFLEWLFHSFRGS